MDIILDDIRFSETVPLKNAKLVAYKGDGFKNINTKNIVELNSVGKIPKQYLDFSTLDYVGTYDAQNDLPHLQNSTGEDSQYYIVNVAGSQDFGSGVKTMNIGDSVIYANGIWEVVAKDSELMYNDDFDI